MIHQGIGCVIMASGMSRRFGSNKLLADFAGEPLICRILRATEGLFEKRVVVTRHQEVKAICEKMGVDVILHDLPNRNDTIRLGMEYMGQGLRACMFCQSDQPLLSRSSIGGLADCIAIKPAENADEYFREGSEYESECLDDYYEIRLSEGLKNSEKIWRLAYGDTVGAPVLFPAWTFEELKKLPIKKGGGYLLKKYPDLVATVQAERACELTDVDTPEILAELLKLEGNHCS